MRYCAGVSSVNIGSRFFLKAGRTLRVIYVVMGKNNGRNRKMARFACCEDCIDMASCWSGINNDAR